MSTQRRTLGIYASKAPLGPNGERLCRNCRGPMPEDKRKHNCSRKCSEEWMCKTSPSHLRMVVERRDKGICALCGLDTRALQVEYRAYVGAIKKSWTEFRVTGTRDYERPWSERLKWLQERGIPSSRESADWWDADHIIPVIEGGGETGIENFRTLCIPCHKQVTRELRARMKRRRIEARPLPLIENGLVSGASITVPPDSKSALCGNSPSETGACAK